MMCIFKMILGAGFIIGVVIKDDSNAMGSWQ